MQRQVSVKETASNSQRCLNSLQADFITCMKAYVSEFVKLKNASYRPMGLTPQGGVHVVETNALEHGTWNVERASNLNFSGNPCNIRNDFRSCIKETGGIFD